MPHIEFQEIVYDFPISKQHQHNIHLNGARAGR